MMAAIAIMPPVSGNPAGHGRRARPAATLDDRNVAKAIGSYLLF